MKKKNSKGFTLIELLVVIGILAILMAALLPKISNFINKSNLSAAGSQGRKLYQGILSANMSLQRNGNKTIWPKTKSSTSGGGSSKIWNKGYQNCRDYFEDLFDVKNANNPTKQKKEIMEDVNVLFGFGVDAPDEPTQLQEENIMWCIAGNLQDSYPDILPVLVTRNVDCNQLLVKYQGTDDSDIPVGVDNGAKYDTPFGAAGFTFIRKNGATEVIDSQSQANYQIVYKQQAFDISNVSGNREAFCYLTPTDKSTCQTK